MGKVAIVGVEGSGKTVLMAALAEKYGTVSSDSVYLMPENQSAFAFMTHIPHRLRKEHAWPAATNIDSLRLMRWSLRVGSEVISDVEMLDYPGELYRLAFGERDENELSAQRAEVHEFLEHVVGAELLVVLLNLNDVLEIGGNPRNAETVWITRGIFDYAKKVPSIKEVLLVFTQADRYAEVLKAEGGPTELLKRRLPMIHVLHPDLECMTVAAVDATDARGNPRENYASQGIQQLMDRILCPTDLRHTLDAAVAVCDRCAAGIANLTTLEELDKLLSEYRVALDSEVFKKRVAQFILPSNWLADHKTRVKSHSGLLKAILSIEDVSSLDAWRRLTTKALVGLSKESLQARFDFNAQLADEQPWTSLLTSPIGQLFCSRPIIDSLRAWHSRRITEIKKQQERLDWEAKRRQDEAQYMQGMIRKTGTTILTVFALIVCVAIISRWLSGCAAKKARNEADGARAAALALPQEVRRANHLKTLYDKAQQAASFGAAQYFAGKRAEAKRAWSEAASRYAAVVDQAQEVQVYLRTKDDFVKLVKPNAPLLAKYGGAKWAVIQQRVGATTIDDPVDGTRIYVASLSALPVAVAEAKAAEAATEAYHKSKDDFEAALKPAASLLANNGGIKWAAIQQQVRTVSVTDSVEGARVYVASLAALPAAVAEATAAGAAIEAYHKAEADFNAARRPDMALLAEHGGVKWAEIQRLVDQASVDNPAKGTQVYVASLAALPAAVAEATAAEAAKVLEAVAAEKARREMVASLVTAAREAKAAGNWQGCLDKAVEGLMQETENADLLVLKREAEGNLRPKLTVTAEVGGREVAAMASDGAQTMTTPVTFVLNEGLRYDFTVTALSNQPSPSLTSSRYTASFSVRADWRGTLLRTVALEEVKPQPGDAQTVDLGGGVRMELAWCPPGTFTMGSLTDETDRDSDETQHRVTLTKGFWLGKYEVTQGQWEAVMGSNPSYFKKAGKTAPVVKVSWNDCQEFVRRLNARVPGGGFRLPTEAEWEYACRAKTTTSFHYGNDLDATMVNYNGFHYRNGRHGQYRQTTVSVGSFRPNEFNLYDMHGNVGEWCSDWYGAYPMGSVTDPAGPGSGSRRVHRGGSWFSFGSNCRSADRDGDDPCLSSGTLGLRLARVAP